MLFTLRRATTGVALWGIILLALAALACGPGAGAPPGDSAPADAAPAAGAGSSGVALTMPPPAAANAGSAGESGGSSATTTAGAGSSGAATASAPAPTAPPPTATPVARARVNMNIPKVEGIDAWLNTDAALSISQLTAEGKVVLVDFWTYTCVNCIRTLPYLREWWSRYADDGLVILGIHAPEFEFEKDYDNVASAIATHDIGWPVAQDNNMVTWRNFDNRYWPAKYLFSSRGEQIYSHFGEGAYGETEQRIRNALVEAGADLSDDPLDLPQDQERDAAFQSAGGLLRRPAITPELYAGWHRNFLTARAGRTPYVAQPEYFEAIAPANSDATGLIAVSVPQDIQPHRLYFHGEWSVEPERTRHARVTEELEDYLALNYAARSVNVVLTSDSGAPYDVIITQDGAMLNADNAGADVRWDENGYSYVRVDEPRMYAIIDNPQYLPSAILTMRSNSDDFGIFAFTFGVYAEGP